MTLVQEFLRGGGTLNDLAAKYAIKAKRHLQFPNLVCLKYSMIDSPFTEPLVRECRGIILDEADGWRVVARTFDKFFNYGEQLAATIDWTTARVQEKCDGSLMQLYWYRDKWHVASSGTPDASGHTMSAQQNGVDSFCDLFWGTFEALGYSLPVRTEFTYALELMTPQNRVVVPHARSELVLLAARNTATGEEVRPTSVWPGIPTVREFSLTSLDEAIASFEHIDPLRQEGYVVVDGSWNRIKVKHPGYLAIAHMVGGGFTSRNILNAVRTGETAELLAQFPEWRPAFDDLGGRLRGLVDELEAAYSEIASLPPGREGQKAFAAVATKTRYPSALFDVRSGKASSVSEYLAKVQIDHLLRALNVKDQLEVDG